jgi:hypothetical protein
MKLTRSCADSREMLAQKEARDKAKPLKITFTILSKEDIDAGRRGTYNYIQ